MAFVTITIKNEAYKRLRKNKEPGDSFSDVILRQFPDPCDTAGEVLDRLESIQASVQASVGSHYLHFSILAPNLYFAFLRFLSTPDSKPSTFKSTLSIMPWYPRQAPASPP
jgi:predicted CopG family antitoxin